MQISKYWKKFINIYKKDFCHWYVHQGRKIDKDIFPLVKYIAKFDQELWNEKTHEKLFQIIINDKFSKERVTAQTNSNKLALVRGLKNVCDTFGVLQIKNNIVHITKVGKKFLNEDNFNEIINDQLLKFQWYNPETRTKNYKDCKLIPYVFLCQLLLKLENNKITKNEYVLFVSKSKSHSDLDRVYNEILKWRDLTSVEQKKIIYLLKEAKITPRGNSIFQKIDTNYSYMANFLASSENFLLKKEASIILNKNKISKIKICILNHNKDYSYINFFNSDDWLDFYGDTNLKYCRETANDYYQSKLVNEKSDKNKKELLKLIKYEQNLNILETKAREKDLEYEIDKHKLFAQFPQELDSNLIKIKKSKEFPTSGFKHRIPILGEADLICKDKETNDLVVIEFKRDRASDKVLGQITNYMGHFLKKYPNKKVKGIIVARRKDKKLESSIFAYNSNRSDNSKIQFYQLQKAAERVEI